MTTNDDEMRAEYAVDADDVPAALEEWDAWLAAHDARVRRDAEAELDSWMARAYEAEKRAWQAEARIKAVEDLCDDADKRHASVLIVTTIRRALDG